VFSGVKGVRNALAAGDLSRTALWSLQRPSDPLAGLRGSIVECSSKKKGRKQEGKGAGRGGWKKSREG